MFDFDDIRSIRQADEPIEEDSSEEIPYEPQPEYSTNPYVNIPVFYEMGMDSLVDGDDEPSEDLYTIFDDQNDPSDVVVTDNAQRRIYEFAIAQSSITRQYNFSNNSHARSELFSSIGSVALEAGSCNLSRFYIPERVSRRPAPVVSFDVLFSFHTLRPSFDFQLNWALFGDTDTVISSRRQAGILHRSVLPQEPMQITRLQFFLAPTEEIGQGLIFTVALNLVRGEGSVELLGGFLEYTPACLISTTY